MNAPDPKTGDSSTRQEGAERRLCMDIGAGRVDAVQSDTDHQLGVYGDIARGRTTKPPAGLVSSSARRRQLVVEQPHGYLRSTVPLAGKCATARPNQRCVAGMNVHVNRWLRVSWWSDLVWVRLFFVGGPISLSGGGEAGGNWIRQGVVRSGRGSGGRRYFCRQRPMGDFRWSSRAS